MKYRREIDGLRALAVLPVVLFHAGIGLFKGGYVGVDIFFVISGYLITTILAAEKQAGTYSILAFYERRARRILPALYLIMALSVVAAWFWLLPEYMTSFARSLIAVPLFASNILFSLKHGYFDSGAELKPLLHTWSLAVEEQYYVLFPVLLGLIWSWPKKRIIVVFGLIALASLGLAQWSISTFPQQTYYLLPTRAWEILLGALLALLNYPIKTEDQPAALMSQALSLSGLLLIGYAVVFFDESTQVPGVAALVPTLGALLIIQFASPATMVGRLLGLPVLVGIGLISYSLYLWHQVVFAFVRHLSLNEPERPVFFLATGFCLLMAYFSWRFIETPFRSRAMVSQRAIFQFAVAGALVFSVIGLITLIAHGFPGRYSSQINSVLAQPVVTQQKLISDGCNLENDESKVRGCVKGDRSVKPEFALIGDSHASALVHELDNAFAGDKKSFVQYIKNGCPFLIGLKKIPSEHCAQFQTAYLNDFSRHDFSTYIVYSRWALYVSEHHVDNGEGGIDERVLEQYSAADLNFDQPFSARRAAILNAMKTSLLALLDSGKNVILVYPSPDQGWDVPTRYAKLLMLGGSVEDTISISEQNYLTRNADVIRLFDGLGERSNLARVRPEQIFCGHPANRCVANQRDRLFYFDDNHLSDEGARMIVAHIVALSRKFEQRGSLLSQKGLQ